MEVSPYHYSTRTGCDYCNYRDICGFDTKLEGYEYRQMEKLPDEEVLKRMQDRIQEKE